jgi:Predicted membrane protein (DUF2142)
VLLVAAWALGNPAFAAPDEPAQYIRGLALARGQTGETPTYPQPAAIEIEAGFRRLTRAVDVPGDLVPPGQLPCYAFQPTVTADCGVAGTPFALSAEERLALDPAAGLDRMIARLDAVEGPDGVELATTTYQGVYPPAMLGAAGVAARLGWSETSGLLLARAASAALCLAFVAAGWVWLLSAPGLVGPRLVGGLLALTPMALFLAATVSGSGIEVAAAFAWVCGLVRAGRGPMSAASVVALALAGVAVTTARQFGPAWLALSVAAIVVVGGIPVARRRVAEQPRAAAVGGALLAAGFAFVVYWDLVVFPRAPERSEPGTLSGLAGQSVGDLGRLLRESIGVFGWLDVTPPAVVPLGWGALVVAVVAIACLLGHRFDRWLMAGTGAGVLAIALLVTAPGYLQDGAAQGRWLLPAAVALPLMAGEVVARRWPAGVYRSWPAPLASIVGAAAAVAGLHALSLWANARRYAVGSDGPLLFAGESRWVPPGGWWPVAALVAAGAVALVTGAVTLVAVDARATARLEGG